MLGTYFYGKVFASAHIYIFASVSVANPTVIWLYLQAVIFVKL